MDIYPGPLTQNREYLIQEDLKQAFTLAILKDAKGSSAIEEECDKRIMPFLNGRPLKRCVYANEITGCALVYKTCLGGSIFSYRRVSHTGAQEVVLAYSWVRGNIELRLVD